MLVLANAIYLLFRVLYWALFIRVILSWFPHDRYHPVLLFLYSITDPILDPFKRLVPSNMGIDFSPIFAFFALSFLEQFVFRVLF